MIPATFYDKLDPTYCQQLKKLVQDLHGADGRKTKILMNAFLRTCLMPRQLWDKYYELVQTERRSDSTSVKRVIQLSFYHFYCDRKKMDAITFRHKVANKLSKTKIMDVPDPKELVPLMVEDLCYPNRYLNEKRRNYEKDSPLMLPSKVILKMEEMKKLYLKIKDVEENGDEEKWIEALMEANDEEFVKNNIEYKLGKDLTNKKLWKLYIEYLKDKDANTLLQTYSKYCRFFTDDAEMKEEYSKAAAEKQDGPVQVLWKNPFQWEKYIENVKTESVTRKRKLSPKKYPRVLLKFNPKNALPQKFPFRPALMEYILTHANSYVLQKLFQSCKWFYLENPVTICHEFALLNGRNGYCKIEGQSVACYGSVKLNNICIATNLFIDSVQPATLSNFFSRLYRCEARYIKIESQRISAAEIKMLLGAGTVAELRLEYLTITENETENFMLEELLEMTPKIEYFDVCSVLVTPETIRNLTELPFKSKIDHFKIECERNGSRNLPMFDVFEMNALLDFMTKNFADHGELRICFDPPGRQETKDFEKTVQDKINALWKGSDKPSVHFF